MPGVLGSLGKAMRMEGSTLLRNGSYIARKVASGAPGAAWSAIKNSKSLRRVLIGGGIGAGVSGVYGAATGQGFFGSAFRGAMTGGVVGGLSRPLGRMNNTFARSQFAKYAAASSSARAGAWRGMSKFGKKALAFDYMRMKRYRG